MCPRQLPPPLFPPPTGCQVPEGQQAWVRLPPCALPLAVDGRAGGCLCPRGRCFPGDGLLFSASAGSPGSRDPACWGGPSETGFQLLT